MTELSPELQAANVLRDTHKLIAEYAVTGFTDPELAERLFVNQGRIHDALAKLPKPVDPDIEEARKLAVADAPYLADEIMLGEWDSSPGIRARLAGIRRGRELERSGK